MASTGSQEERRERWKSKVLQWQESGLSAAKWCGQQNENYTLFLRWRRRFRDSPIGFVEIGPSLESGVFIEVGQAKVRVHPRFDPVTLRQVVQALCSE